ncbi:hypothetical protein JSO19_03790 [Leucobacter sp. UCMA 4100]|uniref:hypothetical protein n=1 Tax=Leucobacter sp. UCMA 4100 TaxID=2810534 RepID=UPI0022EA81A8|nr:hypothetical protein [Leucobacter sp. UCMA 4100]MDA3146497.1 hypothetical protein [Leucobacter sp. UCMA 4100]
MVTVSSIAILCSLLFALLDQPLTIAFVCGSALPVLGVLAILLSRNTNTTFADDTACKRRKAGISVIYTGAICAIAGLITLILDLGVLPQLLLLMGIGAIGGGALVFNQAKDELQDFNTKSKDG